MSINGDLVRSRCQDITDSLNRLERIAQQPREMFVEDRDAQDIACYRLLVAIEAALALCYHIAAHKLERVPEEYAECFQVLGSQGVIPEDLSTRLQGMARFRNLLIHMYHRVDYGRVHEIIRHDVQDLRAFCSEVIKLI